MAAFHLLSDSSDKDGDTRSSIGDSENNTTCPKCGIKYGDSVDVACGTTKSVQTLRKECQGCFIVKVVLLILMDVPA